MSSLMIFLIPGFSYPIILLPIHHSSFIIEV